MFQGRMIVDGAARPEHFAISVDLDTQSLGTVESPTSLQKHLKPAGILNSYSLLTRSQRERPCWPKGRDGCGPALTGDG